MIRQQRKSITKAIFRRYLTQNQKLNRKWKLRRWHSVYVKDHTRGRAEKGIPSYKRKNREGSGGTTKKNLTDLIRSSHGR